MENNPAYQQSKIELLGADKFILALEHHDKNERSSGNTCHYVFEIKGEFDVAKFQESLANNELFQWVNRYTLCSKIKNSNYWELGEKKKVSFQVITSDEEFPQEIIQLKSNPRTDNLLHFFLVRRSDNTEALFFSWHHLLMDAYGATLLLKNLHTAIPILENSRKKSRFTKEILKLAIQTKRYITKSSKNSASIPHKKLAENRQNIRRILFSKEESERIEELMVKSGVKLNKSHYALACSFRVNQVFFGEGAKGNYWLPVPQDSRKKGSNWPVIGNNLSFVFYAIPLNNIDKKTIVKALNQQLMEQVRRQIPKGYLHLSNFMRHIPSKLYAKMIQGSRGKSLTSFLFTNAPSFPSELEKINGCEVKNISCIPPNLSEPGLTISTSQYSGRIQLLISTYESILSKDELDTYVKTFKAEMLTNKH